MRIRIFRASTLAEAMAQIRSELGPEALILSDCSRDGFIEVTAALETSDAPDLRTPIQPGSGLDDLEPFHAPSARPRTPSSSRESAPREPGLDAALAWHGIPAALITALRTGSIEQACARTFRFTSLRLGPKDSPLLLAGPPGAGKTLTVARLATRMVLAGQQPMVITADGRRAGAVEQLAAFTRLLGLTLVAANTPATLGRALERRADQPVLIDAPGLDLDDPAQAEVLQALLAASGAVMALVLPCGLDLDEAQEIAAGHTALGAQALIATRADPARRLGGILSASASAGLALAEAGVGSAAADSLMPLTPAFLAERLRRGGAQVARYATSEPATPAPGDVQARHMDRVTQHSALSQHIAAQRRAASNS